MMWSERSSRMQRVGILLNASAADDVYAKGFRMGLNLLFRKLVGQFCDFHQNPVPGLDSFGNIVIIWQCVFSTVREWDPHISHWGRCGKYTRRWKCVFTWAAGPTKNRYKVRFIKFFFDFLTFSVSLETTFRRKLFITRQFLGLISMTKGRL